MGPVLVSPHCVRRRDFQLFRGFVSPIVCRDGIFNFFRFFVSPHCVQRRDFQLLPVFRVPPSCAATGFSTFSGFSCPPIVCGDGIFNFFRFFVSPHCVRRRDFQLFPVSRVPPSCAATVFSTLSGFSCPPIMCGDGIFNIS